MIAEKAPKPSKMPRFHSENPAPAWCRNVLRLSTTLEGVAAAVVGLKQDDRWITFTRGAEAHSSEDLVAMCECAVAADRAKAVPGETYATSDVSDGGGRTAGVRLRDPEGRTVGALCVIAPAGGEVGQGVEQALINIAALVAPLIVATIPVVPESEEVLASADPAFLVRVVSKIQPLISEIVAFSDVMQREVIGTSRKRAEIVHQNGTRVLSTLKSVLDLIDLETIGMGSELQLTDVTRIAREELEAKRHKVRKRGLRLELEGTEERVDAMVDGGALRRILDLLLTNAISFTQEGGITVAVVRTAKYAEIAVIDTGRGIGAGFLPRIFEPFAVEEEEGRRDERGMGMGLALAKRIADQAGLEIAVESRQAGGSTFTVRCPLAAPKSKSLETLEKGINVRLDLSDKPLILLVEDNEIARRVIEMMLRDNYDIIAASTHDEALRYAREYQFDLLLLDIGLNERRTGVEVLHDVRRIVRYHTVPAVACTAYSLPGYRERFLEAGFDGYIAKPYRARHLLETITAALEQGRTKGRLGDLGRDIEIDLPPLPATLPRLLELVSSEEGAEATKEVTEILMSDPAAASWVLGHANSAYYSVRGQVGTIDRAVMLLGAEAISNLVIAGLVARTLDDFESDAVRQVHAYILHASLGTAGFARELAERLDLPNPELAFTAGMLHDVGRLFLLAHDPQEYAKLWLQDGELRPPELGQELLTLGLDHTRVGIDASGKWELPAELHAVVSSYEDADRSLPRHRSLVSVIAAARAAAITMISGEEESSSSLASALRRLDVLHDVRPGELRAFIDERKEEVQSLLDSMRALG